MSAAGQLKRVRKNFPFFFRPNTVQEGLPGESEMIIGTLGYSISEFKGGRRIREKNVIDFNSTKLQFEAGPEKQGGRKRKEL